MLASGAEQEVVRPVLAGAFRFLKDPPLGQVRYRVAYGGRGGAKSWQFARALLIHAAQQRLRILCTREFQSSIRESVHRLLESQIEAMGLGRAFKVEKARIRGITTGSEFIFIGLHRDPDKIKSLEGVDVCWVEEGHTTTAESWRILTPTIRKEGSEIWVTFNPAHPDDPLYQFFVDDPPENALVHKVGADNNPWLSQALKDERADMLRRDPEAHAHVWGGEPWYRSKEQILADKIRVAEFDPEDHWGEPLYGADWGFAQDPTTLLRLFVHDSRLWIHDEVRGIGWSTDETERRFRRLPGLPDKSEPPDDADDDWQPPIEGPVVRSDSARPETINELRLRGLNVVAAKKWPGSVEDGIEHLRSYEEIVVHPRCEGMIQDSRLYRYKVDARTGDVLPAIVDANNHGPDAARYALVKLIRRRKVRRIRVLT